MARIEDSPAYQACVRALEDHARRLKKDIVERERLAVEKRKKLYAELRKNGIEPYWNKKPSNVGRSL